MSDPQSAPKRVRCAAHGLVYDPVVSQAGCVVCRRTQTVPAAAVAADTASGLARHRGAMWLGSLLLFLLLLAGYYVDRERTQRAAAAGVALPAASGQAAAPRAQPLRVLFVGNSLTSTHDVPGMVAHLARAAGEPRRFEYRVEVFGGFALEDHLSANRVQSALAAQRWDAVVLQEQGQRPGWPQSRESRFFAPARELDAQIRRAGAVTVFYETYARREGDSTSFASDTYEAMQRRVGEGYRLIARELNAGLVPVGTLWARSLRERPALRLWEKDGMHASQAGSYLAGAAFYAHFYRRSPVGNPYLANLDAGDARALQALAAAILEGELEVSALAAPAGPSEAPSGGTEPPEPTVQVPPAARPQRGAAADAERDRARHERIMADIEARELQAARSRVPVTLYKTSWCGPCKRASAYMREHGIACSERDVEMDAQAAADIRRLNPRGSVPTIDVGGEVLIGWSSRAFEAALDRAARGLER